MRSRDWAHALIQRIPKKNYDPEDLTTLRDISLLPCLYKVFIKGIVERVKSRIIENIGYWQRAYISKRDRQDLIFCLKTAIDDFRHSSSKFYTLFVDFRDAFGSLSQEYLIKCLLEYGIQQTYRYIIADVYQKSHSEVLCDEGLSKEFELTVGEKTGDPASPFWFILALDKTLRKVVEVSFAEHRIINKPIINQNRIETDTCRRFCR